MCRHRHSIYISWSNGTQKVITSLGKSLFFSFWLKPADSSFSCWHFLVSLCYAYTMTKVIITNYLNTYTTCTYVKKDMSVSFWFKPEKIFYYWLSWLQIGLYFHLISLLSKWHFFLPKYLFFTWNWCIFFCIAKFLFQYQNLSMTLCISFKMLIRMQNSFQNCINENLKDFFNGIL